MSRRQFTVTIAADLGEWVNARAEKEGMTISAVMTEALLRDQRRRKAQRVVRFARNLQAIERSKT